MISANSLGRTKIPKLLDRYLIVKVIAPMSAIVAIGLLALSAARFVIVFDVVAGSDHAYMVVAQLLGSFVPHYLAFMLPFAVYWSSYVAVRNLTVNSELASLQASGISLLRIFLPLVILGTALTLANILIIGWLEPMGRYTYRGLISQLEKTAFFLKARDETFMQLGSKTVFVERIQPDRRSVDRIFIFDENRDNASMTITAQKGELLTGGPRLVLRLFDGQRLDIKEPAGQGSPQSMDFDRLDVPLDKQPAGFRPRGDDEQELVMTELLAQENVPTGTTLNKLSIEFNRKLVIAVSSLVLPILAACLATLHPRRKSAYLSALVLLVVLGYHQSVEFGAKLAERQGLSAIMTVWPPFLVVAAASAFLFFAVNSRPGFLEGYVSFHWRRMTMRLAETAKYGKRLTLRQ